MFPDLTRDDVFRIETKRLWLRWPRMADAGDILRLAGVKQVAEMTGRIPHPYPAPEAAAYVEWARNNNSSGAGLTLAMTLKEDPDRLVGMIGVSPNRGSPVSLGYWLGTPHWGQGLTTEAAQALIDTVFTLTDACEITAGARTINPSSRNVLQKCGFQFEGQGMIDTLARGVVAVDKFRLSRRTFESLKRWRAPSVVRLQIDANSLPMFAGEPVLQ